MWVACHAMDETQGVRETPLWIPLPYLLSHAEPLAGESFTVGRRHDNTTEE